MHRLRRIRRFLLATLALGTVVVHAPAKPAPRVRVAQTAIDPEIAHLIETIPAIDNHAHPVLPPPNDTTDREFDALPVDNMEPQTDPVAWRADNPQLAAAWKALWGFTATAPLDAVGLKRLQAARARVKAREGVHYDEWVLDQANIQTEFANRVRMGNGVAAPRFRWVPYDDALLFPLNNSGLAAATPDRALFFPLEAKVMRLYLHDSGVGTPPATLNDYLQRVLIPTVQRQKADGAVAIKFEVAYLRSFDFGDPSGEDAARVYAKYAAGGVPTAGEYKLLQDFLFRSIAAEAGRLGLPVHLHCMSGGGGYFNIAGGNPMLLEPLFNDARLRSTKFVLLHGGWPFVREAGALLQKPNVYLDLSQQALTFPPHTLASWLREWLEMYPDKVLYGTDGYPFSDSLQWEESVWIDNRNARDALGIALTGMVRDGEIDRARAKAIATMVLRGSAMQVYDLNATRP